MSDTRVNSGRDQRNGRAPRPHFRASVFCANLVCILCLIGMLAACGAQTTGPTAGAAAKQTATAQAIVAATPVHLAASVTQTGTVVVHDVRLAITVTVTNTTAAPIYVAYLACHHPIIHVELRAPEASTHSPALWQNWGWDQCFGGAGCPTLTAPDTEGPAVYVGSEVASQATYTWTATGDLSQVSKLTQAGPYSLTVITGWLEPSSTWLANCRTVGVNPPLPILHEITTTQTITLS